MTIEHLSDVALVEWALNRDVRAAAESRFRVEAHLSGCAACRARLVAHEALERACDPWFAPRGADRPSAPVARQGV
jgi:anti-sigma factor RsiW